MRKSTEERFWDKVDKSGDCWIWTASCFHNGYGRFKLDGKIRRAHRVSFTWENGDIPEGMQIDHRCHTRKCVRPSHLRLATNAQNGQNRMGSHSNSKTGVRGVSPSRGKYQAMVCINGRQTYVGRYDTIEEAEIAVKAKRKELFTHDDFEEWDADNPYSRV